MSPGLPNWLGRQVSSDALLLKATRFGMIGALSGAVYFVATMALVDLAGVGAKSASVIAYILSMPLNFVGNRRFSFRSRGSLLPDLLRFVMVHAANLLVAMLAMGAVVDLLGTHYLLGAAVTIVLMPLVNFAAMNWWVFRGAHQPAGRDRTHGVNAGPESRPSC